MARPVDFERSADAVPFEWLGSTEHDPLHILLQRELDRSDDPEQDNVIYFLGNSPVTKRHQSSN